MENIINVIYGDNGTLIQSLVINLLLNFRFWVSILLFCYFIKQINKKFSNTSLFFLIINFLLIISEYVTIRNRFYQETIYSDVEYVKKETDNLVIAVQGVNNPFHDVLDKNKTQVDITKSRDLDGIGYIQTKNYYNNTQVMSYVSSHSNNLTTEDIFESIYYYKTIKPNGKVILVGHSVGGNNIIECISKLSKFNVNIDLVILIDIANKRDNNVFYKIPTNVKYLINYYSLEYSDKFYFFTNSGGIVSNSKDNNYTKYTNIYVPNTTHTSIDNVVYLSIDKVIKNYVEGKCNPIDFVKKYN
jgi:hypothetical protein